MNQENLTSYVSSEVFGQDYICEEFEQRFLNGSNISVIKIEAEPTTKWKCYTVKIDEKVYKLHVKFKNVTGSGWANKPQIKRIQIGRNHLDGFPRTDENELSLLAGFVMFKNSPIFCFWNPQRYLSHKTVCSCYVNVSSINNAFECGYYFGHDSGKEIYVCDCSSLRRVIIEFISNNFIGKFKW